MGSSEKQTQPIRDGNEPIKREPKAILISNALDPRSQLIDELKATYCID